MAFKMNKPSMIKGTISHKTAINRSLDKPPASSAFQKVDPEDDVITREEKYYKQEGLPGFEYEGEWTPDPNDPYSMIRKGTKTTTTPERDPDKPKMSKEEYAKLIKTEAYKQRKKKKRRKETSTTEEDVLRKPITQDIETIMPTLEQELTPPTEVPLIEPKKKIKRKKTLISKYKRDAMKRLVKRGFKKAKHKIYKSGSKFCYQDDNGNQICA